METDSVYMLKMTNGLVRAVAGFCRAAGQAYQSKGHFLVASALAFALSFGVLSSLGLTPDPIKEDAQVVVSTSPIATSTAVVATLAPELPVKIAIPAISLSVAVADPVSTDVGVLDTALLSGAVRYPTSAKLGQQNGNVVIFGHSSYLPIVHNQAYKTFDGIQKLKVGDTITVYSSDRAYTYAVRTVSKESADSAGIPLTVSGQVLTLSTCDSFGEKSDRFVVTADFVESHAISS